MKQKHFFQEIKWLNVQWIFYLFWTSGNKRKKNQACIKPSFKQFYFSQTYNMLILFIFKIKNKIKRQGRVSNPSNLKFVNKVTWRFCSVVRLFYEMTQGLLTSNLKISFLKCKHLRIKNSYQFHKMLPRHLPLMIKRIKYLAVRILS